MNKYWVWFSRLCKIDVKTKNKLLEKYKTPEKIWNLSKKDLERNTFLNQEKIEYILNQYAIERAFGNPDILNVRNRIVDIPNIKKK